MKSIYQFHKIRKNREIALFAVLKLFPTSKIDFWPFLKLPKMEFGQKKNSFEIDLFDFTSFLFGLFLIFWPAMRNVICIHIY